MPIDSGLWAALAVLLSLLFAAPFVALAVYFVARLLKNGARNRALLATGAPAPAVILSAEDTGVTVNDSPQVRLNLEVRPAGMAPYRAQATLLVGRLQAGLLMPGMPVQVKYDPADPSRVAVESFGGPAPMNYGGAHAAYGGGGDDGAAPLGTIARRMQDELHARRGALDLTDARIRIGDGASVLRFGLNPLPTGRPAFRAETR